MAGLATEELGTTDDQAKPMTANDVKKIEKMYKCTVSTTPAPPTTQAPCENKNSKCDYWAKKGWCTHDEFAMYMMVDCEKACKFC